MFLVVNLVEEGKIFFSFIRNFKVRYYVLMVSFLVRVGFFNEVKIFIEKNRIG